MYWRGAYCVSIRMNNVIIRKYEDKDRPAVRQIAWDTAYMGRPAGVFFGDKEVLEDILTLYFTDYEPESCFVAESGGNVVGYLIGCKDSSRLDRISLVNILPGLILKILYRRALFDKLTSRFLWRVIVSLAKRELFMADFSRVYPATLHINLSEGFRGKGAGAGLMSAFMDYLIRGGVKGVRLATYSASAAGFFRKSGFEFLCGKKRSYFSHLSPDSVEVMVFGRKLR